MPKKSPSYPALSLIFCPPSPPGKGEIFSLFCRGLRPRHPGIKPLAALTEPVEQAPAGGLYSLRGGAGVAFRYPAGAWQLRRGSGEQSRQPRRGGTGGEELRRLRWSSPPGQVEPVPRGFSRPAGHHSGRDSQCRRGSALRRAPQRQVEQVPREFSRPAGHHSGRANKCRAGSVAGMQGGFPPAAKKTAPAGKKIRKKALTFRRRRRIMS